MYSDSSEKTKYLATLYRTTIQELYRTVILAILPSYVKQKKISYIPCNIIINLFIYFSSIVQLRIRLYKLITVIIKADTFTSIANFVCGIQE